MMPREIALRPVNRQYLHSAGLGFSALASEDVAEK